MADDEPEDLIDVGSDRGALLAARVRRHPLTRALLALAVLAAIVAVVVSRQHDRAASLHPAAPNTAPAPAATASPRVDDSYLYAVPAQDLRAALATDACRTGCVAHALTGRALLRAAASFSGLTPLAGGRVSRHGTVIFQSIEARAVPDALVHLVLRRVSTHTATEPAVLDRADDDSRTVTVGQVRDGWRLTASIVVRGSQPPSDAALAWSATTRLP